MQSERMPQPFRQPSAIRPIPHAVRLLCSASAALLAATAAAQAQPQPAVAPLAAAPAAGRTAADGNDAEAVIVTGARGDRRTVLTSPTPIDVLSDEAITSAGKPGVLETLNALLPSFNLPAWSGWGNGTLVRAGQLRGLSPDLTLVLVNGKRRHATALLGAGRFLASAPADLSLIPSGAVERIEVLRDGASAIYGSDAIAGVVNLITRKASDGGSLQLRAGQHYEGDGTSTQVQGHLGFALGDRGGHLTVAGQYDEQKPLFRDGPVPARFLYYFPRNAAGQEVLPAGSLSGNPSLPAGATPDAREATRNNTPVFGFGGLQAVKLGSASVDVGLPLYGDVELYGLFTLAHRESRSPQYFRHPSRDENVRAIYPDGFTPYSALRENDFSLSAGLRGGAADGWRWDASATFGRDDIDTYMFNSVSPTFGLDSKTDFYLGKWLYESGTANLDLRRSLDWGGRSAELSVGLEARNEKFVRKQGEYQSWAHGGQPVLDGPNAGNVLGNSLAGSQAQGGIRPEDEVNTRRDSAAVYAGVSLRPTSAWLVDAAARYERYSDFGDTATGRLSSRYEFGRALALRGTVSTGFHAPALAAQSYRNTNAGNIGSTYHLPATSIIAQGLGAQTLTPEKATNVTLGLVASPTPNLNVALDLYQIDVKDRIGTSTPFREALYPGSGALVLAAGFQIDDSIQYFINAADTRTRGVDLTLDGRLADGPAGRWTWSLAANYNETTVTNLAATPAALASFNIPVFSAGQQNDLKFMAPRYKAIGTLNWRQDRWGAQLRATYYGTIRRVGSPTVVATEGPYAGQREIFYDVGKILITDLEVSYAFSQKLRLTLTANNLFDRKPRQAPEPLLNPFQTYSYVNNGPVTAAGGFCAATLRWDF